MLRIIENINEPRTKLNNLENSKLNCTQQQSKSEAIRAKKKCTILVLVHVSMKHIQICALK